MQVARTSTRQVLEMLSVVWRAEELSDLAPILVLRGEGGGFKMPSNDRRQINLFSETLLTGCTVHFFFKLLFKNFLPRECKLFVEVGTRSVYRLTGSRFLEITAQVAT